MPLPEFEWTERHVVSLQAAIQALRDNGMSYANQHRQIQQNGGGDFDYNAFNRLIRNPFNKASAASKSIVAEPTWNWLVNSQPDFLIEAWHRNEALQIANAPPGYLALRQAYPEMSDAEALSELKELIGEYALYRPSFRNPSEDLMVCRLLIGTAEQQEHPSIWSLDFSYMGDDGEIETERAEGCCVPFKSDGFYFSGKLIEKRAPFAFCILTTDRGKVKAEGIRIKSSSGAMLVAAQGFPPSSYPLVIYRRKNVKPLTKPFNTFKFGDMLTEAIAQMWRRGTLHHAEIRSAS